MESKSDIAILILASGQSTRWDGPGSKHFVLISGTPLLCRTLDQLKCRNHNPIIVGSEFIKQSFECFLPQVTSTICHTLISTGNLWSEQTVILLGDVIFTEKALDLILNYRGEFCVFTDTFDIFAISFNRSSHPKLIVSLNRVVDNPVREGRLHELYREWHRGPPIRKFPWTEPTYQIVDDATQDFDCLRDYTDFLFGITKNHLLKQKIHGSSK